MYTEHWSHAWIFTFTCWFLILMCFDFNYSFEFLWFNLHGLSIRLIYDLWIYWLMEGGRRVTSAQKNLETTRLMLFTSVIPHENLYEKDYHYRFQFCSSMPLMQRLSNVTSPFRVASAKTSTTVTGPYWRVIKQREELMWHTLTLICDHFEVMHDCLQLLLLPLCPVSEQAVCGTRMRTELKRVTVTAWRILQAAECWRSLVTWWSWCWGSCDTLLLVNCRCGGGMCRRRHWPAGRLSEFGTAWWMRSVHSEAAGCPENTDKRLVTIILIGHACGQETGSGKSTYHPHITRQLQGQCGDLRKQSTQVIFWIPLKRKYDH